MKCRANITNSIVVLKYHNCLCNVHITWLVFGRNWLVAITVNISTAAFRLSSSQISGKVTSISCKRFISTASPGARETGWFFVGICITLPWSHSIFSCFWLHSIHSIQVRIGFERLLFYFLCFSLPTLVPFPRGHTIRAKDLWLVVAGGRDSVRHSDNCKLYSNSKAVATQFSEVRKRWTKS